jgi:hypothetical protein
LLLISRVHSNEFCFADHSAARRSDCVLEITNRLHRRSSWRAEGPNIPHRRLAEEAAVFAIELGGALVSDLKSRTGGVKTVHEHAFPRSMQPKLLLISPSAPRVFIKRLPSRGRWEEHVSPRLIPIQFPCAVQVPRRSSKSGENEATLNAPAWAQAFRPTNLAPEP